MLGQRARVLGGDRGHDVARAVGGELRAQRHGAAREVAAQPRRAPLDLLGLEVVAPAQLLQERAAQVLLDLHARLLDRHLGQAGDGGDVQELQRVGGRLGRAEHQHGAELLVAGGDRHLGDHARRHRGRAAARTLADVAPQRGDVVERAGRRRRAEARDDDRHHAAGLAGGQRGHALEPVAAEHDVDHPQVHRPQPLDHAGSAATAPPSPP